MKWFANESIGVLTVETDIRHNQVLHCHICYWNVKIVWKFHVDQHSKNQHKAKLNNFKSIQLFSQTMFIRRRVKTSNQIMWSFQSIYVNSW